MMPGTPRGRAPGGMISPISVLRTTNIKVSLGFPWFQVLGAGVSQQAEMLSLYRTSNDSYSPFEKAAASPKP